MDVSLLSGLHSSARKHFAEENITSLQQIVAMPWEKLTRFKGIKTTAPAIHAHARAFVENRPIWFKRLPVECYKSGFFFDIETTPPDNAWSIGWSDEQGVYQAAIVVPTQAPAAVQVSAGHKVYFVRNSFALWQTFCEAVSVSDAPIYHWTKYDPGIMSAAVPSLYQPLANRFRDLHHIFKHAVKFPVQGNSIKAVAPHLGFRWSVTDDWSEAYLDYASFLNDRDPKRLERTSAYQRDDVIAMDIIWRWLVANNPEQIDY